MSDRDDGGPAFPRPTTMDIHGYGEDGAEGMTLRDYFAARAMASMIAKSNGQDTTGGKAGVPLVAKYAYEYADAMLNARERARS